MEGKKPLKRYLLVICVSLSLLAGLGLGLFLFLCGGITTPVHLHWQDGDLEFSRFLVLKRGDLLVERIRFQNDSLKLVIPRLRISMGIHPPFLQAIEINDMETWVLPGDRRDEKPGHFSHAQYGLLRYVKITNSEIHYVSQKARLDLQGVTLLPSVRNGKYDSSLLSASFQANVEDSHLQGNLSASLDFVSADANVEIEGLVQAEGLDRPVPMNLRLHLPFPDSLARLRGGFSLNIPNIEAISEVQGFRLKGSISIDGKALFSLEKGLEARGRLCLPFGIIQRNLPVKLELDKALAYTFNSSPDLSRMDITFLPEGGDHSNTRVEFGYEPRNKRWKLVSDLQLRDLSGSRDSDHAFEGLDLKIHLALAGDISRKEKVAWRAEVSWDRGQVLIYPWFFDLSALKGALAAGGRFSRHGIFVSNIKLQGPFMLKGKEILLPPGAMHSMGNILKRISISSLEASGDLEKLYDLLLKEPFSDSHPALSRFEPAGSISVSTMGKVLRLDCLCDVNFSNATLLKGLHIRLPYPFKTKSCESGTISWQAFYLNNLLPSSLLREGVKVEIKNSLVPMEICQDLISAGPLELDLQHGQVCVHRIRMELRSKKGALEGVCIKDLDIKRLFRDFPYEMKVEAKGISAELRQGKLVFSGQIKAKLAGGTIIATHIWLEPFAPIVRYGADISFDHLDLEMITAPTAFGVVSGVVKGWIKGLVMSGIQPERFRLVIENDDSAHVPQKISIKAVENLSILGGGQGSVSFLGYFFKKFSYKRIGISCSLQNDVFVLHGLIKKGGKEYLVERGFLGGVNVINMNPGGRIRFKDMVERLQRITESEKSKMEVR